MTLTTATTAPPSSGAGLRAAADATAAQRREMKFTFPHADLRKLERVLEMNMTPLRFATAPVSQVSSIYFDDDLFSSCHESLAGVDRRTKVRLRWYDRPLPAGSAFFEIKQRTGTVVSKDRTPVTLPDGATQYGELIESTRAQLRPADACWLDVRPRPVAIIAYRRRHYLHRETGVRATLDFNITGYDQLGRRSISRRFPVALDGLAVIEVKAPAGAEQVVPRLLHPLRPRLSRLSKYVQCCALMGWCPSPDDGA